jgi:hypothetical protein
VFWFNLEVWLIAIVLVLAGLLCLLVFAGRRTFRFPFVYASLVLFVAAAFVGAYVDQAARVLRNIDFQASLPAMTDAIKNQPTWRQRTDRPDMYVTGSGAFFLRFVFFSPDPYCGYEFVRPGGEIYDDPLGSGRGSAIEQLAEGWYWICAS